MQEDPVVSKFRDYLRIKTVQPDPDYDGALSFLTAEAEKLGLPIKTHQCNTAPARHVIVITWEGTEPQLPSLLLNSHTDVVPVYPEHWKHDAFSAHKDENGDIYGRGTQDMKCVTIQYLEAVRRLVAAGRRLMRTLHLSFVPDEEVGGFTGMDVFVKSQAFRDLNVGFALDEGLANPGDNFTVFYGERSPWWINISAKGQTGHGSRFIEDNAAEKIRRVINSFLTFRDEEEARLKANVELRLGDVTTVNLTKLSGGVQVNVVPQELCATFDVRITPTVDLVQFEAMVAAWCAAAGNDVTYTFDQKYTGHNLTPLDAGSPWWAAFKDVCAARGWPLDTEIFPAATDSRYLRQAGFPCLGFSPMKRTPILLHDHNEFINEQVFLEGIDVYEALIPALASLPLC